MKAEDLCYFRNGFVRPVPAAVHAVHGHTRLPRAPVEVSGPGLGAPVLGPQHLAHEALQEAALGAGGEVEEARPVHVVAYGKELGAGRGYGR